MPGKKPNRLGSLCLFVFLFTLLSASILPAAAASGVRPLVPGTTRPAKEPPRLTFPERAGTEGKQSAEVSGNRFFKNLSRVWNYELLIIDEKPLTVQKIVVAIFILIVGLISMKFLFKNLRKRVLPRTQLKATTAANIEKMLYYFSVLLVVLFSLRLVNIPLTIFAFLGGAIAIGVGFGAQNLINNFISGFIIMGERPVKIGDIVEVDGHFAVVEEIGARCTRIRTGANIHILVPNASFLEKNIVNWTLSDQMIRTHISVGVAYGSPVREARNGPQFLDRVISEIFAMEAELIRLPRAAGDPLRMPRLV